MESQLGRLVRIHHTDLRARRFRVAGVLCAGVAWMTAAVAITVQFIATRNAMFALGPALGGPGTVCLWAGISKLRRAFGTKRERVELYERGIVVHLDDEPTVIPWRDIHQVGKRGHRATPLERIAGVDHQWKIWIVGGRSMWFDSSTEDAQQLGDTVTAAWQREQHKRPR